MMTASWYPWVLWPAAVFNLLVAVLFLLRWSVRIKINRDNAWRGMVWLAVGVIAFEIRAVSRYVPGGLAPLWRSQLDAATALLPHAAFAIAFTHWLIHNRLHPEAGRWR